MLASTLVTFGPARIYLRYVIVAVTLALVILAASAGALAWTAQAATLLVALDSGDRQSVPLLSQWCATQASIAPTRQGPADLELRRRRSLERVHAVLVAEDRAPTWLG